MFLWTLPWTTRVILALLTNPAPWPNAGEWTTELSLDLVLLMPLMVVLGQVYIRIAASLSVPKSLRSVVPPAVWTSFCQMLFADVLLFGLLSSVAPRVDLTQPATSTSGGWNEHWGWNGPFLIFTVRLAIAGLGLTVGESFFPLALTGGIACGKSTISKLLQQRGNFTMIDADKIGHQILLPPWHEDLHKPGALVSPKDSVYVNILQTFASDNKNQGATGSAIPGVNEDHPLLNDKKCIDRAKLGAKVFANPADRKKLNAITHKRIFYCLLKNMAKSIYFGSNKTKDAWVCAEIPLLFESGPLRYVFGLALVVACTPTQQFERLRKRNPELTKEECQKRIESQMPMTVKVQKADIVLWNDKEFGEEDDKKEKKEDELDAVAASSKREEALMQQVDKAVRTIQQRVHGILETSLTQILILLSASMVVSACFKLFMGNTTV